MGLPMKLKCPRQACGYVWDYKGTNAWVTKLGKPIQCAEEIVLFLGSRPGNKMEQSVLAMAPECTLQIRELYHAAREKCREAIQCIDRNHRPHCLVGRAIAEGFCGLSVIVKDLEERSTSPALMVAAVKTSVAEMGPRK